MAKEAAARKATRAVGAKAAAAVEELVRDGAFGPSRDPATPDIAWVRVEEVHPWPDNPRINKASIEKVRASIEKFGWVRPLVANTHPDRKGELIIGHTAHAAALAMKAQLVPVRFRYMEPADAHAAALADNRLNEIAEWDYGKLGEIAELGSVTRQLFDVAGFDASAYERLLNRETGDFLAGSLAGAGPAAASGNSRAGSAGYANVSFTVTVKEKADILAALSRVDPKAAPSAALVKLCRDYTKGKTGAKQ